MSVKAGKVTSTSFSPLSQIGCIWFRRTLDNVQGLWTWRMWGHLRVSFFVCLLTAAPMAYGSSSARDWVWATAVTMLDPLPHCAAPGSKPTSPRQPKPLQGILVHCAIVGTPGMSIFYVGGRVSRDPYGVKGTIWIGKAGVSWGRSGLRIQHCHYCDLSYCCITSLIPGFGTSMCRWHSRKKKKKKELVRHKRPGFVVFELVQWFSSGDNDFVPIRYLAIPWRHFWWSYLENCSSALLLSNG